MSAPKDIQWFHGNSHKHPVDKQFTVALELPSKSTLIKAKEDFTVNNKDVEIPINIGISKLHHSDSYVKKIGRDVSVARMTLTPFYMLDQYDDGELSFFYLEDSRGNVIELRVSSRSDRVWFLRYN